MFRRLSDVATFRSKRPTWNAWHSCLLRSWKSCPTAPRWDAQMHNLPPCTTNTLTCNVRIARSNSWSICRHVQSQRMAVWKQKSWSDPKPSTTLKHVKHVTLTFSTFKKHTQQITKCKHWPEIHVLITTRLDSRLCSVVSHYTNCTRPTTTKKRAINLVQKRVTISRRETKRMVSRGSMSCFSCSSWGGGQGGTRNA